MCTVRERAADWELVLILRFPGEILFFSFVFSCVVLIRMMNGL